MRLSCSSIVTVPLLLLLLLPPLLLLSAGNLRTIFSMVSRYRSTCFSMISSSESLQSDFVDLCEVTKQNKTRGNQIQIQRYRYICKCHYTQMPLGHQRRKKHAYKKRKRCALFWHWFVFVVLVAAVVVVMRQHLRPPLAAVAFVWQFVASSRLPPLPLDGDCLRPLAFELTLSFQQQF